MYVTVADLRRDAISEAEASDERLQQLIDLAGKWIDRLTGRFFEPRLLDFLCDGSGTRTLRLGHPIIAIRVVAIDGQRLVRSAFHVYNRHISDGLLDPDDRDDPRIEFAPGPAFARWPRGSQNIRVRGVFGYTDPDGSTTGRTPALIQHVTKLLVIRELPGLTDREARAEARNQGRLVGERTRDQAYTLAAPASGATLTGDPEIDDVIILYRRPAAIGAA